MMTSYEIASESASSHRFITSRHPGILYFTHLPFHAPRSLTIQRYLQRGMGCYAGHHPRLQNEALWNYSPGCFSQLLLPTIFWLLNCDFRATCPSNWARRDAWGNGYEVEGP
jgi:hypothetical protein